MTTGKIFISYRRTDTEGYAGRIFDRLGVHFGRQNIFMDVDTIQPGENFINAIEKAVSSCDVLIALIGDEWLMIADENGNRRLDNPHDFVRVEISTALKRDIRVIPVLLAGTVMPKAQDLPDELQLLIELNALEIRHGSFDAGIEKLKIAIDTCLREIHAPQGAFIQRIPVWAWITAASSIFVIAIILLFMFLPKSTETTASTSEVAKQVAAANTHTPTQIPSSTTTIEIPSAEIDPTATDSIANTPTTEPTESSAETLATKTPRPTETPIVAPPTEIPPAPLVTPDLPYGDLIMGPKASYLYHDPNSYGVKMSKLYYQDMNGTRFPVSMQDFIIEAVFYNPYGSAEGYWDFGLMFRDTSASGDPNEKGFSQARIVITNEVPGQGSPAAEGQGFWAFYDNPNGARNLLDQGPLSNLDTNEAGANHLILMAKGPNGEMYLNGELIGILDLSSRNQRGSVWVAISFNFGHEKPGAMTRIEEIRLWEIKPEP